MHIIKTIVELQLFLQDFKKSGISVGFVPTMGALHEGHLSLIRQSSSENQFTICSIFVNPTQFNNPQDLIKYPKTLDQDISLLKSNFCDLLFLPSVEEMYPQKSTLKFSFGYLESIMEGKFRPGHFNGVATIVSKLLNIVQPQNAYFGTKDLQQCVVIESMVNELNFPVKINRVNTLREVSGLAMSSRNLRLSESEKELASFVYKSLQDAKALILGGKDLQEIIHFFKHLYSQNQSFKLEYFEIVNAENLLNITHIKECNAVAICIAVYLGEVRLIDNLIFNV